MKINSPLIPAADFQGALLGQKVVYRHKTLKNNVGSPLTVQVLDPPASPKAPVYLTCVGGEGSGHVVIAPIDEFLVLPRKETRQPL